MCPSCLGLEVDTSAIGVGDVLLQEGAEQKTTVCICICELIFYLGSQLKPHTHGCMHAYLSDQQTFSMFVSSLWHGGLHGSPLYRKSGHLE